MNTFVISSTYSSNDILDANENSLKRSSSLSDPLNFSLPLTLDLGIGKSSSSSSNTSSTTTSVSNSPSPVPSSSSSSISSYTANSYLSTSPSKLRVKEDTGDEFYQYLQNHSSLLRIVLQKEFPLKIVDDQWYRLDLQVVNELGLPLGEYRTRNAIMGLACELLELQEEEDGQWSKQQRKHHSDQDLGKQRYIQDINEKYENSYSLSWRALQFDAWEWDEETQVPGFAGFEKCNKGGLEFKIQIKDNHAMIHQPSSSPRFFMRIIPTFESHQTIHALPLVVGPFSIMESTDHQRHQHCHHRHHLNNNNNKKIIHASDSNLYNNNYSDDLWIMDLWYQEMYRAFKLNIQDRYFLVKEGWTLGTPGKMWDSALVLSDILVRRVVEQPDCFHQCHILDLSAGTGIVGLLIAFYYQHLFPQYRAKVTLTDLPEALHLIQHNQQLNDIKTNNDISIQPLEWGNLIDIKRIKNMKPIDIIIASDVLYQPSNFKVLVDTLVKLSTPGHTVIYLGYKRRGLEIREEEYFFDLCRKNFHLQIIKNNYHDQEEVEENIIKPVPWEKRYGGLKRDQNHVDGYGWLGPCVEKWKDTNKYNHYQQLCQQTGVQIFRLIKK